MKKINLNLILLVFQVIFFLLISTNLFASVPFKINVQMGVTAAGRFFFWDRDDGKIYIYDDSLSQCNIYQVQGLGEPIVPIK